MPDVVAGVTLAAVAIPECMGYTKIVGTPVVTGLYTILLPIAIFALLGSSRHLVVGADSATAAILFSGLTGLAQPLSPHWVFLTSAAALITAAFLLLSSLLRLGFLSNFLSRTVLVGFLSGVGVSLVLGQVPDMLGVVTGESGVWGHVLGAVIHIGQTHALTFAMAVAVVVLTLVLDRIGSRVPGALVALVLAIATTWAFRLDQHGIVVVGAVVPGVPRLQWPTITLHETIAIVPTCASMFLVIVAQSAATARSFAQKYGEPLDEDRDLFALAAANAVAGLSSTFVVNGSPTKTAIVDAAGSRTQVAQLATAVVVLSVLLLATTLIEQLPVAALAALVFLVGLKLIDVRSLRQIYRFRILTFMVALSALVAVVSFGVERGIFVAIVLSVLDHLRQEYRPKDVVLTAPGGKWRAAAAEPGCETEPGLIVYRFDAPLFFANADYFATRVQQMIASAPHPVRWFVLDLVSMNDLDYTGGLTLARVVEQLRQQAITVALVAADDISDELDHLGITAQIGRDHLFESVPDAVDEHRRANREVETPGVCGSNSVSDVARAGRDVP
jgi:high affinity sulfate transporter 1